MTTDRAKTVTITVTTEPESRLTAVQRELIEGLPTAATTGPQPTRQDLKALANPRHYAAPRQQKQFPAEIVKLVEDGFQLWLAQPQDAWQVVKLSTPELVERVIRLARDHAWRREIPVTVQIRKTDDPRELVFRVRTKIKHKTSAQTQVQDHNVITGKGTTAIASYQLEV